MLSSGRMYPLEYFNSHAHVERDALPLYLRTPKKYFNSHAHVERDITHKHLHPNSYISTHTLTWSVTPPSAQAIASRTISTHTLTWSVTLLLLVKAV